ncbi:calreticulin-like [Camellia sinensis]|uniref:calreticulin-like n=1 Tax=Camellia sinensis TaxID=4442 RepID=UPI001036D07C|nr:calreticulin-like [Camellia sinensis]
MTNGVMLHRQVFSKYVSKWIGIACPFQGAPGCINDSLLTGLQFVEGFESFFFVKRWTMHQLKIKNPNYQRKWKTPMIDNPEFKDDPEIYVFPKLKYVGIDLWQVKSGTLFDNVLICDDPDYAMKLAEETWGKQKDAEKAAFDEVEKKREKEVLFFESKDDPVDSDAEGDDDEIDKDADITEESAHDEL